MTKFKFDITFFCNFHSVFYSFWHIFKKLTYDGIHERYGETISKEIEDRVEYELGVIEKMGYVDYFLIVWDYVHWAKSHGIPVGPGRGSGAGSIVAYAIGITDIDPIKYELIFERFLNPERISMPDFDIDFDYEKRQEVIDYVSQKYGREHVSQIITFGTMSARMVIRDVGRVLDFPYSDTDKLAKMIPNEVHITISSALEKNKELSDIYENDPKVKNLLDLAMKLEGLPRQTSTHACGIIIAKEPVVNYVPLYARDGVISTQFIMTTLEELGLLKMDFLGLRTLTVIRDCVDLVKKNRGIDVKFDDDMDDPKVFEQWQDGNSIGIFQFESQGMTNFMKELKPDCLEDIIAGVSLYRPGPMDQIPRYIANKKNPEHAVYTHDSLKPILSVTYGCMVYQEQVMQIVRTLAGYSLGQADLVRRAMGKKKLDVMAKERENFIHGKLDEEGNVVIKGCVRNGIDEVSANKIFDEMAEFAKYAFNKSHAACYAVIAYQTAFLKTYYPAEFMAAMLNSFLGNLDKVPIYINECRRLKIDILKPDINKSETRFTVEGNAIRFGLGSIKNVGLAAVDFITEDRKKKGEFKDFGDFAERISGEAVNKKCVESLIRAGAFDDLGKTRACLLASFEDIIDVVNSSNNKGLKNQVSMFEIMQEDTADIKYNYIEVKDFSEKELLSMEKEMLGIYISGHPLEKYRDAISNITNINSMILQEANEELQEKGSCDLKDNSNVVLAGIITGVKKKFTKKNTIMCFVTIEDLYGSCEMIVFETVYNKCSSILLEENIVQVSGRISIREDQDITIIASEVKELDLDRKPAGPKALEIDISNINEIQKERLRGILLFFRGDKNNLKVEVKVSQDKEPIPSGAIYATKEILAEIAEIVGKENIKLRS